MWILILIAMPVVLALSIYLYFFLKRIFITFGANVKEKKIKIILVTLSLLGFFGMVDVTGIVALILLHVLGIAAVLQSFNYIVQLIFKKTYTNRFAIWKRICGLGIIPILLTAIIIIGGYINLHNVVKTEYTIYTDKEIREEGYRIALIADVHYGVSVDFDELKSICRQIGKEEVDLVVLCGDIVDDSTTKKQVKEVFQAFGSIESTYGTYYVYGNHDRPMSFVESPYTLEELTGAIEQNNIRILRDEVLELNEEMMIVGRDDRIISRRSSIEELFEGVDKEKYILTLDHQPNEYEENGKAGTDLLLSGHTHGGQIFPLNWVQEIFKINDAVYGHTQIDSDTQAIVTSGFAGWSYPVKTSAPAEYVIIDIVKR